MASTTTTSTPPITLPPPPATSTPSTPPPPATTPPPPPATTTTTTSPPATTPPSTTANVPPPQTTTSTTSTTSTSATPTTPSTPPTTTSTTTSTTAPSITPATSTIVITPGGQPVTITSVIVSSSSRNVAPTGAADGSSSSNKGFFHNTGAVAGVFTVVGLIVLAILIAFITNTIRRRRAKKFDDEIAAAAHDAANAPVPHFGYDDDDDFRPGGAGAYGSGGAKFSDMSHGTFTQPPMSVPESYGMRELPHHGSGPNPGEYFDPSAGGYAPAGAAGIGVARARSMRDGGYAAGLTEGTSPYAAFAAPGSQQHGNGGAPQYPPGMIRGAGAPEFDLNRRPSQYTQQTDYSALSRNKSLNTMNSGSAPSYQSDPYNTSSNGSGGPGQQGYPNSFGAYANVGAGNGGQKQQLPQIPAARSEEDLNAAYDGYVVDEAPALPPNTHAQGLVSPQPGPLPNPFSAKGERPGEYADETDDEAEEPRRVLKVCYPPFSS
ncbi:hypothetical protein P691DRAFT_227964 [Macrolepiota fuliginosa MF-IS2]|uniref:Uncharacterized protein n=1 Tax=Macrolepiota fuliginosa MF-IS2 TaxID=1400762 RepID=A0A9P5X8K3_9AGAR|nr:hypothetical protein P691DRAFT_227964 [Macrolepiota fuliginosa MF-IS2]